MKHGSQATAVTASDVHSATSNLIDKCGLNNLHDINDFDELV
jgi:hypothetical protein